LIALVERLDERQLLASFSPLGGSLPDLAVSGYAAPVAAWTGPLAVTLDVTNLGSNSSPEPLALAPGSPSTTTSGPATVGVYVAPRDHFSQRAIRIGTIDVPSLPQNSLFQQTDAFTLPKQPRGFPGSGGTVFVFFRIDNTGVSDRDRSNNTSSAAIPVQIAVALPDLFGLSLDVPPTMQPGDTIQPNIKIVNYGTVDPATQGPFDVYLVASTDTNFGPGDTILSRFTVTSLPPLSEVPSQNTVLGDVNIQDPINVLTLKGTNVTLPTTGSGFFIGVIVDPTNQIREIHEIGRGPSAALEPVTPVGPPIKNLPPAGVIAAAPSAGNVFPFPAFGPLKSTLHPENGGSNPFAAAGTTAPPNGGNIGALIRRAALHGSGRYPLPPARIVPQGPTGRTPSKLGGR
jgi:hypothetical protein